MQFFFFSQNFSSLQVFGISDQPKRYPEGIGPGSRISGADAWISSVFEVVLAWWFLKNITFSFPHIGMM